MVIERKTPLSVLHVNMDLAYEVYKAKTTGDPSPHNKLLEGHPLEGRQLFDHHKQETYTVQSVHKHWYGGWYMVLLLVKDGSHACVPYRNLGCIHPTILGILEEAKYRYQLLEI